MIIYFNLGFCVSPNILSPIMSTTITELKVLYFDLDYELHQICKRLADWPLMSTDNVTKKIQATLQAAKITREQLKNMRSMLPVSKGSVTMAGYLLKEHFQSIKDSCAMIREYMGTGMLDDSTGLLQAYARPGPIALNMDYSVPLKPGFTKLF